MKKQSREDFLQEIGADVRVLTDRVSVSTPREALHPDGGSYRVSGHGLVLQLVAALPPGSVPDTAGARGPRPGSRQPSAAAVAETLELITGEAAKLREDMRAEVTQRSSVVRRRGVISDLREIRRLSFGASLERTEVVARMLRRWVSRSREVLTYDAPVMTLSQHPCPYCHGCLQTRSDASSDVWCAGRLDARGRPVEPACRDEDGNRLTWPRSSWIMLLERMSA